MIWILFKYSYYQIFLFKLEGLIDYLIESLIHLFLDITIWVVTVGRKVTPEDWMIKMTTTVELDSRSQGNLCVDVAFCDRLSHFFFSDVQVVNVGRVMLGMMEFHDFTGYNGLQSLIIIRQIRKWMLWSCEYILAASVTV